MNPSIHFDGAVWRCLLRCTDYAMPDGVLVRSDRATPGEAVTRNAMVILDPSSWKPIEIYKIRERDGLPRASCSSVGFEDIRLFSTQEGGLQGIAASLHLRRDTDGSRRILPEQVLVTLDGNYDVTAARPLRGAWSDSPQKNWAPFDRVEQPRFLFSIERGEMIDGHGQRRSDAVVTPPEARRVAHAPSDRKRARAVERARAREVDRARDHVYGVLRGQRPRPTRDLPIARAPSFEGLRGGSQLCRVGTDEWLGIGHGAQIVNDRKYYWHVWYLVDAVGKMRAASPRVKLAQNGIEFAAGMAIDGDRVVVSFGVDDMACCLGEARLPEVLSLLSPVEP